MGRSLKTALGIGIVSFLIVAVVQNLRTQQQISDLQKQIQQNVAKAPAAPDAPTSSVQVPAPPAPAAAQASPAAPQVVLEAGPGGYVQKQDNIQKINRAAWGLLAKRDPAAAAQAAEIFQEGLKSVDDSNPDLYNGLGRALLIAGRPPEAIAAWKKGLTLAPKYADMQSGIGWAYWNLHDPYHAKRAWEEAVAINAKCVDAWSALAWIDMALGNKDRSVVGFQTLIAFDSKNMTWITGLSMARGGNRDLAQIRSFFPLPELGAFSTPPTPAADPSATTASALTPGL